MLAGTDPRMKCARTHARHETLYHASPMIRRKHPVQIHKPPLQPMTVRERVASPSYHRHDTHPHTPPAKHAESQLNRKRQASFTPSKAEMTGWGRELREGRLDGLLVPPDAANGG